jgi:pimeloyl-ACP methyl ester carboxylesterase
LDVAHAEQDLCDWVVHEMDRTPPMIAAAMHDCFEGVDAVPLLSRIVAPTLLLSGDSSPIASAQQQTFTKTLSDGRIEVILGVGHGVNLLQPERRARRATEFWQSLA